MLAALRRLPWVLPWVLTDDDRADLLALPAELGVAAEARGDPAANRLCADVHGESTARARLGRVRLHEPLARLPVVAGLKGYRRAAP